MATLIPLTQGKFALVDDEDAERVNQFNWCYKKDKRCEYAIRPVCAHGKETTQSLHRFILNPSPGMVIDHINGNGLDCRRSNMRICTQSENKRNRHHITSASGYKGVMRYNSKWRARLGHVHLGMFESPELAARAYDKAARKYFGEFAKLNFP